MDICQIRKGIPDTFVKNSKYFRDMGIQSFLNLGVILVKFANLFLGLLDTFQNI